MRFRLSSVVLAFASFGVLSLALHSRPHAPEIATPDPSDPSMPLTPRVVAQPEPTPQEAPGLATPRVSSSTPKPRPKAKLDTVEPWHGEDLEAEVALAILERPHLDVDRLDPWNPAVYYPSNPNIDPGLEEQDPWAKSNGQRARRIATTTKKKAALESTDPWSASPPSNHDAKLAPADETAPAL